MTDTSATESAAEKPQTQPAPPHRELDAAALIIKIPLTAAELERYAAEASDSELLGQSRALDAVRLAIGIDGPGYNAYVSGLRTREERVAILHILEEKAHTMPTPGDWIYVHNFHSPEAPKAIYLQAGQGLELRARMTELIEFITEQLPKSFRREDFDQERVALRDKYNRRAQELFGTLEQHARARGFAIQGGPGGQIIFLPLIDGKPPESPEELQRAIQAKTEAEREALARSQSELQDEMASIMMRQQEITRELINDIRAVERTFASRLIGPAVAELKRRFADAAVDTWLDAVAEHMLSHLDRFRELAPGEAPQMMAAMGEGAARWFEYQVNVMVDNSATHGAPVISEDSPTYRNLFGTIERWIDPLGRGGTNFTRIIAGSFLKSHGGFLVIDLEDAVAEPGVWKSIVRALKSGHMTVETLEPFPFFSMSGLRPEPIQMKTKLVVLGGAYLYNLLYFYDSEFAELFKVKAELLPAVDADRAAATRYAAHVGALARREDLPQFEGGAIERIVQYGMRLAGDRSRMLAILEPIDDLARESAYFARREVGVRVQSRHVERALSERILRRNFIEEEIRRLIANGTIVVRITGAAVGEINGLAILDVGGYAFGRPSRVTAAVALGQAGLINIEREAHLSGSTHDKGMMILTGFLRARFAQSHPIAMSASICFEQSYSGIDGDSASSTELYALFSALSGVPIRQDLAVTGSVDQYGRVQAIGGVNEKIEGFYRVCKAIGLTGTQGVLVPASNVSGLMLDAETAAAVGAGRFHIYPVESIDHGIEILTGVRAGAIGEPGTINDIVDRRLRQMSDLLRDRAIAETRIVQEAAQAPLPIKPPAPPEPQR
jgi:ATP-dependent Lon protease